MKPTYLRALHLLPPVVLWASSLALMALDVARDPYDPTREGTSAYGHNGPDSLSRMLPFTVVELLVTLVVLQPWKETHRGRRALGLLMVLVPWTLLSLVMMMHAGGVVMVHGLWLMALVALVGVYGLVALVSVVRAKG